MKILLLALLLFLLAACSRVTPDDAREIAYQHLSSYQTSNQDGPSLRGEDLRSALSVSEHAGGEYLVELRVESRNLLWAVIVKPSGESEITRMANDG